MTDRNIHFTQYLRVSRLIEETNVPNSLDLIAQHMLLWFHPHSTWAIMARDAIARRKEEIAHPGIVLCASSNCTNAANPDDEWEPELCDDCKCGGS